MKCVLPSQVNWGGHHSQELSSLRSLTITGSITNGSNITVTVTLFSSILDSRYLLSHFLPVHPNMCKMWLMCSIVAWLCSHDAQCSQLCIMLVFNASLICPGLSQTFVGVHVCSGQYGRYGYPPLPKLQGEKDVVSLHCVVYVLKDFNTLTYLDGQYCH